MQEPGVQPELPVLDSDNSCVQTVFARRVCVAFVYDRVEFLIAQACAIIAQPFVDDNLRRHFTITSDELHSLSNKLLAGDPNMQMRAD